MRAGPGARPPRAAARRRRRPRDARAARSRRRRWRSKPRAPNRRAPNGCSPSARCRRGASRTRGARWPSPRRGCRRPRRVSRSATKRCAAAAARRPATRSRLRAPIAGRVAEVMATLGASYDEGAPLFKIVRTDRVELRAQVPAADAALVRGVADVALEIPGRPDPIALQPHHMHDAGVIDPNDRRLPVQFEVDNPGGQLLVGQSGTAVLYQPRQGPRCPPLPKPAVLTRSRPPVRVRAGRRRAVRAPLRRDRDARRRSGRHQERRQARRPRRHHAAPTKSSSRRPPRGCRPKATCTEGRALR